MTEWFAPAVARGPSSHSYPTGNWRTRASAYGREGSAAKCSSSAAVQPSQNAESAGPSRRRPRSHDAAAAELHPPQSCEIRAQRTATRAHPLDQHHRRGFQGARAGRSAERSSRTARSARSRRATAARSPGRAAGPPRRTAPRAWPDRPAAGRAPRRARPRGGTRRCSCPSPRGRRRRSAGPARRTAPGCAAGKRGARGRSCGPAYEPVRSTPQVTPVDQTNIGSSAHCDSLARIRLRTAIVGALSCTRSPTPLTTGGFAHEPTDLTQNCADRRARGGGRRRYGVVRRLRSRRDPGCRPAPRGRGGRLPRGQPLLELRTPTGAAAAATGRAPSRDAGPVW